MATSGTCQPNEGDRLRALGDLMGAFIDTHRVPGSALAIVKDGRLVYARGFGVADRQTGLAVTPRSLFRIASVSKPFTAVAVMRLVETGRFQLDAPVMPLLEPILRDASGVPGDERLATLTVRHLLAHRGGWDRARSGFFPLRSSSLRRICRASGVVPPGTPETVIRYMLAQPLDFTPGTRFAYANVGYLMLGRIIEIVSGRPYQDYVRQEVLQPLGIGDMRIGGSSRNDRFPGEVCYYTAFEATVEAAFGPRRGQRVPLAYARSLAVQEAAGGWIASVVDLARFIAAFQLSDHRRAILDQETIRQMITAGRRLPGDGSRRSNVGYGLGWYVERDEQGRTLIHHTGHLPGTGAFMGWRSDGVGAAVLFNCDRTPENDLLINRFLQALAPVVDRIAPWPEHDLFPLFFR
jgi:N-acyl-D-amino-acid deacylase